MTNLPPHQQKPIVRQSHWDETKQAMAENNDARPDFSTVVWKSFLGLGAVSAAYFVSLAITDPVNFREGAGIFWKASWQLSLMLVAWAGGLGIYRHSAPENQKKIERGFLLLCLGLLLVVALFALGILDRTERRVWANAVFIFSLGAQLCVFAFLIRLWKRLRKKIAFGDTIISWHRPLLYLCEGTIFYLMLGIFMQAVLHIHVPAILGIIFHSPKAIILFFIPFCGYFYLRKLVGEI